MSLRDGFERLATAPGGVARLRELILSLAMAGKLVPQDPTEEAASELLRQIRREKDRLISEGKIKREKPLPRITDEEQPNDLPNTWEWIRLNDLLPEFQNGASSRGDKDGILTTVLRLADIKDGRICLNGTREIAIAARDVDKYNLAKGDILAIRVNGSADLVGRFILNDRDLPAIYCDHFIRMRVNGMWVWPAYLAMVGDSRFVRSAISSLFITTAGQKTVNQGHIGSLIIPLPPLDEQRRIVAKVDELMHLCDELETRGRLEAEQHARLTATLFDALAASESPHALVENWARVAAHFDLLLDRPEAVDALEQTILELAVRGLLVPQDKSEEPVGDLLQRIQARKDHLIALDGLRTTAQQDVQDAEKYLGEIPGWEYCRLGNLARFIDYRGRTPKKTEEGIPLITAKNVRFGYISCEPREYIAESDYETWMTRGFPQVGDLLFTTEAPLGNIATVDIDERFALAQRVICFQLHDVAIGPYVQLAMMSAPVQEQLSAAASGMTATGIKASRLKEIPIAIPPLAEQRRLVACVEKLRRLCVALRARLTDRQTCQAQLAEALVEQTATAVSLGDKDSMELAA
jgi:type I restriction enzyme S subunit